MRNSPRKTSITDIAVEAAIPVLIIGLIWSLVVFAITVKAVFYPGQEETLTRVFFLYVMGTVMANRLIGLYGEYEKGAAYSIVLVLVMALFALSFSARFGSIVGGANAGEGFLVNFAIVAVIGLASYKICRESCLDIERKGEKEKSPLKLKAEIRERQDWYRAEQREEEEQRKREASQEEAPPLEDAFPERHPGRWVIYFSLFSMLVFAVGQRLLPSEDWRLYSRAFNCLLGNLVCALGLLLLITLSAVRRECWKKMAAVPSHVGWFWTITGTALMLAVLALASAMPRPVPEYLFSAAEPEFSGVPSEPGKPKKYGAPRDTWAGMRREIDQAALDEQEELEQMNKEADGEEEGGGASKDGEPEGAGGSDRGEPAQGETSQGGQEKSSTRSSSRSEPAVRAQIRRPPAPRPPLQGLTIAGKILFIVLLAISLVVGFVKLISTAGKGNLAARLSERWRRFAERFRSLLKSKPSRRLPRKKLKTVLKEANLYLENPFTSPHLMQRMSKAELVRYTYRAFENYAHVHGHTPRSGQTPTEFVNSLPAEFRAPEAAQLLRMFMLVEYSTHNIPDEGVKTLRDVWARIEA